MPDRMGRGRSASSWRPAKDDEPQNAGREGAGHEVPGEDWRPRSGGSYRDRTDDIHGVSVALYQLS